ncbi:spore gernimation protein GerC [Bacillus coahuilensis p1.1.43]|uniref:Spore gernimation protein GerC n=2 Tax=Bacillus coahuilensis TaxID=408580 RepID=A0A147K591_9BACI|nr:spore gernimation protein GerC [Bacillus coahuilensis p1.1.43]
MVRCCVLILCCLMVSSCSGLKNIQDLTYIVAIGMDYDEDREEYITYIQGLNFANVAKQEGGKPVESVPIFIASARGETLNLAISNLYKTSEPPLFFGHTLTLVLTDKLAEQKFNEVIEEIGRNRSLRPTLRVIVTQGNMEETLNTKALFNYPAIYTVLFKKSESELSQDELKPVLLMDFLRDFYEPMGTAKIPIVRIDKSSWQADEPFPVLYFDGFAAFQQQEHRGNLSFDDAFLTDWLHEKQMTMDHKVEIDGELIAAVELGSPKMKVQYEKNTATPMFSIELSVQGDLLEKIKDIPLEDLEKKIEDDMKNKLLTTYQTGLERKLDLLNVGDSWYRKHPILFRKLTESKEFYLDSSSLTNVKVDVTLVHFNSYKYNQD